MMMLLLVASAGVTSAVATLWAQVQQKSARTICTCGPSYYDLECAGQPIAISGRTPGTAAAFLLRGFGLFADLATAAGQPRTSRVAPQNASLEGHSPPAKQKAHFQAQIDEAV